MRGRIDHEGIADPVPADQKLPKGEGPARHRGLAEGMRALVGAIQQQHQHRQADEQRGKKIDRSKGKGRNRARQKGQKESPPAGKAARDNTDPMQKHGHAGGRISPRRMRSRFTRLGSASRTSNSYPAGWATISPRCGNRPNSQTTSPPSESTSSSASGIARSMPVSVLKSSSSSRASAM